MILQMYSEVQSNTSNTGLLSLVLLLVVCIKIKVADRLWLTWRRVKEYCTGETSNLLHWYRIGGGGGGDIKIIMLLVLN